MIYFIGAGPGDKELLTVKGARILSQADCVVYAGSLVNPELLDGVKDSCTIYDSSTMTLEDVIDTMMSYDNNAIIVRLHSGDPSIYGAIREQIDCLVKHGIEYEIIPGVSSFSAAAAVLGAEYTLPGISQTVILTRLEGRTPVPPKESITELARIQTSMVIFLSSNKLSELSARLLEGGYAKETPAAIVYKATWTDEIIVRTTVGELENTGKKYNITKTALILVGHFLGDIYERSQLYHPKFTHGYRTGEQENKTKRNIFLMFFTANGEKQANRIAEKLSNDPELMIHRKRVRRLRVSTESVFKKGNILVFIGAAGITVRAVAPLLQNKMTDPAVIVIDESGRFVIPMLSGHIGGANQFAERIASLIGAVPVLTTATDINHVFSVDSFAVENGYDIVNPKMIKKISARLLAGKNVGLASDYEVIGKLPEHLVTADKGEIGIYIGTKLGLTPLNPLPFNKTLHLLPKCYHVGIGTKRDISFQQLRDFFYDTLIRHSISVKTVASLVSIDRKRNEKAILDLSEHYNIPFHTYQAEELQPFVGLFTTSEFVQSVTGIGNVCESAAYLASNRGKIVVDKISKNGITIAVAEENWNVHFSNID
ncbi:MAG: precorrin-4 C(11)-methyltransferase [Planctomycetaceae bacterium]|jgi:precorrin-4/cobalt-precorrin-4 C11-methyltransferase|nr:precorrin-4 C(11)-methyltransferase [Planctomycetaceae bacterium]